MLVSALLLLLLPALHLPAPAAAAGSGRSRKLSAGPGVLQVRLAGSLSLTGRLAPEGLEAQRGLQLLAAAASNQSGVGPSLRTQDGRRLEVTIDLEDDHSDEVKVARLYAELAADPDAWLVGPVSGVLADAAREESEAAGRVLLQHAPLVTQPQSQSEGLNLTTFAVGPLAPQCADHALETLRDAGVETLAVAWSARPPDVQGARAFCEGALWHARARGLRVVFNGSIGEETSALATGLHAIAEKRPDAFLFCSCIADTIELMKTSHALELDLGAVMAGGATSPSAQAALGAPILNYVLSPVAWDENVGGNRSCPAFGSAAGFAQAFRDHFGEQPSEHAAAAAAAGLALLAAVAAAAPAGGGPDEADVMDALQQLNISSFFGQLRFDSRRVAPAKCTTQQAQPLPELSQDADQAAKIARYRQSSVRSVGLLSAGSPPVEPLATPSWEERELEVYPCDDGYELDRRTTPLTEDVLCVPCSPGRYRPKEELACRACSTRPERPRSAEAPAPSVWAQVGSDSPESCLCPTGANCGTPASERCWDECMAPLCGVPDDARRLSAQSFGGGYDGSGHHSGGVYICRAYCVLRSVMGVGHMQLSMEPGHMSNSSAPPRICTDNPPVPGDAYGPAIDCTGCAQATLIWESQPMKSCKMQRNLGEAWSLEECQLQVSLDAVCSSPKTAIFVASSSGCSCALGACPPQTNMTSSLHILRVDMGEPVAKPGYFSIQEINHMGDSKAHYKDCPIPELCLGSNRCQEPSSGLLCLQCQPGYIKRSLTVLEGQLDQCGSHRLRNMYRIMQEALGANLDYCQECPGVGMLIARASLIVVVSIAVLCFFVSLSLTSCESEQAIHSMILRTCLDYWQITVIIFQQTSWNCVAEFGQYNWIFVFLMRPYSLFFECLLPDAMESALAGMLYGLVCLPAAAVGIVAFFWVRYEMSMAKVRELVALSKFAQAEEMVVSMAVINLRARSNLDPSRIQALGLRDVITQQLRQSMPRAVKRSRRSEDEVSGDDRPSEQRHAVLAVSTSWRSSMSEERAASSLSRPTWRRFISWRSSGSARDSSSSTPPDGATLPGGLRSTKSTVGAQPSQASQASQASRDGSGPVRFRRWAGDLSESDATATNGQEELPESLEKPGIQRFEWMARQKMSMMAVHTFLVCLLFLYPVIVKTLLQGISCRKFDEWRMRENLDVICRPDSLLTIGSVLGLVVYGLGAPLAVFVVLFRKRQELSLLDVRGYYGFLYNGFVPRMFWFEVAIMLRKFFILVSTSLPMSSASRILLMLGAICVFAWVHFRFRPYDNRDDSILNWFEWASTAAQVQVLSVALWWEVRKDSGWSLGSWALGETIDDLFIVICVFCHIHVWLVCAWGLFQNTVIIRLTCKATIVPEELTRFDSFLLNLRMVKNRSGRMYFDPETHFLDVRHLSKSEKRVLITALSDALHCYMNSGQLLNVNHLVTVIRLCVDACKKERNRLLPRGRKNGDMAEKRKVQNRQHLNTISTNELHNFVMRSVPDIVGGDLVGKEAKFFEVVVPRFEGKQDHLENREQTERRRQKQEKGKQRVSQKQPTELLESKDVTARRVSEKNPKDRFDDLIKEEVRLLKEQEELQKQVAKLRVEGLHVAKG